MRVWLVKAFSQLPLAALRDTLTRQVDGSSLRSLSESSGSTGIQELGGIESTTAWESAHQRVTCEASRNRP